jgi:hypothetical protein
MHMHMHGVRQLAAAVLHGRHCSSERTGLWSQGWTRPWRCCKMFNAAACCALHCSSCAKRAAQLLCSAAPLLITSSGACCQASS